MPENFDWGGVGFCLLVIAGILLSRLLWNFWEFVSNAA